MTDTTRPPAGRTLSRLRDTDPSTAHDLAALDDAGIRYEIVAHDHEGTTLRFWHLDLRGLAEVLRNGDVKTTDQPLKKVLDEIKTAAEEAEYAGDELKRAARDIEREVQKVATA